MSRSQSSTSTVWRRWPKRSLKECMSWRKLLSMLRYILSVKGFTVIVLRVCGVTQNQYCFLTMYSVIHLYHINTLLYH